MCCDGSVPRCVSICENGQKPRWRAMRTSYPPLTSASTLPSTGSPALNASSSWRSVAAPRVSARESVSPPAVETTIAWIRSPTLTSMSPSSSFSSATSITASPLPPTSTKATSGPIATIVPSMVCPCVKRLVLIDASNIAAKSSSLSLTVRFL